MRCIFLLTCLFIAWLSLAAAQDSVYRPGQVFTVADAIPNTCTLGSVFIKNTSPVGLFACTATDTWVSLVTVAALPKLDDLSAPDDNTDLNSSTSLHGLMQKYPGGTTTFLRADGTFTAPGGGADPWAYVQVNAGADFTTTSSTAVNATGLAFTPTANTAYEFEALLMIRTATTTVNPRVGFAWPTGMTDGVVMIEEAQAVNTVPLTANGNINAASLVAVGGLPNTTQSWPVRIQGTARAGATPSGDIRIQLASETAGTTVRIVARSWLRYRTLSF